MFGLIGLFIGPVFNMFKARAKDKRKIKVELTKARIAQIRATAKLAGDADLAAIQAQRYSIKDEILMVIIFAPFVGSFIPGLQPYVIEGFQAIKDTPTWYQSVVVGICISVFGLRFMWSKLPFGGKK